MQQIRVKILTAVGGGGGKWEIIRLDEFLYKHSPSLSIVVQTTKQFPPLHILNEELLSGGKDQGMSGGCFWKPFELSEHEYEELSNEMLTNPAYDLSYDETLESKKSISKWNGHFDTYGHELDNIIEALELAKKLIENKVALEIKRNADGKYLSGKMKNVSDLKDTTSGDIILFQRRLI